MNDPEQEFAERVANEWFDRDASETGRDWLVALIANELRSAGWVDRETYANAISPESEEA